MACDDVAKINSFFSTESSASEWIAKWQNRIKSEGDSLRLMQISNPIFIPRNHRVEEALAAANLDDLKPLNRLLKVLSNPFENHQGDEELALPPKPEEEVFQTFCGT